MLRSNPVNIGSCAPPISSKNQNCEKSAYRDEASRMCEISHSSFELFSYAYMRTHVPSNHVSSATQWSTYAVYIFSM